jgi:hypothetical protein
MSALTTLVNRKLTMVSKTETHNEIFQSIANLFSFAEFDLLNVRKVFKFR